MGHVQIEGLDPIEAIIPTSLKSRPKEYRPQNGKQDREACTVYDHSRVGSYKYLKATTGAATFWRRFDYIPEYCTEHQCIELVPSVNHRDLYSWYDQGLHPRFSIRKALLEAKQLAREVMEDSRGDVTPEEWSKILNASRTPKQFLDLMAPHLFVNYYVGRRRLRLRAWFKEKCNKNSFSVEDFFQERNQELRRLMLRHGVRIADVIGRLKLVSEDEEGKLYDEGENQWSVRRYLYVKCPSTGQEYLLAVPINVFVRDRLMTNSQRVDLDTPKKARRWTFGLRQDAEFMAEA